MPEGRPSEGWATAEDGGGEARECGQCRRPLDDRDLRNGRLKCWWCAWLEPEPPEESTSELLIGLAE